MTVFLYPKCETHIHKVSYDAHNNSGSSSCWYIMHCEVMCESVGNKEYNDSSVETDNKESFESSPKTYLRTKSPIFIDEKSNERFNSKCYTTGEEILCSEKSYQKPDNQEVDPEHESADADIAEKLLDMSSDTSTMNVKKIVRQNFHMHILPYKNIMSIKNTHESEYFKILTLVPKRGLGRSLPRPALLVEKQKIAFPLRILVFLGHKKMPERHCFYIWCPREDSNLHTLRHSHLKAACLPISPPGHVGCTIGIYLFFQVFFWRISERLFLGLLSH